MRAGLSQGVRRSVAGRNDRVKMTGLELTNKKSQEGCIDFGSPVHLGPRSITKPWPVG